MIYLDNAASTYPKPPEVIKKVMESIKKYGANPGRSNYLFSIKTSLKIFEVRQKIANFFGCKSPETVIFTLNCTAAINIVLKGFLKPYDHVVISCLEHNSVVRPLEKLLKKGITYSKARVFEGNNEKTLKEFEKCIKKNTKLIAITSASNVWGIKLPVKEIAELAHKKNIPILVDAAQTAGIFEINLEKDKIDFLCASGFKGLYGLMGVGFLIFRNKSEIETLIEGGTGFNSKSLNQPEQFPEKFESGTINVPGIMSLGAGIDFVNKKGIKNIAKHEFKLILKTYKELSKIPKVKLYTKEPNFNYAPLLSFCIKNKKNEEISSYLDRFNICVRSGFQCARLPHEFMKTLKTGTVRISPSVFTKENEINFLLNVIDELAKKVNLNL